MKVERKTIKQKKLVAHGQEHLESATASSYNCDTMLIELDQLEALCKDCRDNNLEWVALYDNSDYYDTEYELMPAIVEEQPEEKIEHVYDWIQRIDRHFKSVATDQEKIQYFDAPDKHKFLMKWNEQ